EHGEGTTALPSDLFKKMVATLPLGEVTLQIPQGSQTLNVTCPGANTNIRGVDPREFPVIPGIEGECDAAVIDAGLLRTMMNQVVFHLAQGEQIDFVSRLIEGVFPPYKKIIPREHTTRAVVDTRQLATAVARAGLFAVDLKKSVRVTFKPQESGTLFATLTV